MNNVFDRDLALGALTAMFILAIAPALFPPRKTPWGLPETPKQLIAQYIYGTAALLAGQIIWLSLVERALLPEEVVTGILVITVSGGGTVVARYVSMWAKQLWTMFFLNRSKATTLENERKD